MASASSSQIKRRRAKAEQPALRDFADPSDPKTDPELAIPRRPAVSWWLGVVLAVSFAAIVTPALTAERWLFGFRAGTIPEHAPAPFTVRAPNLAGLQLHGGVVIARGELASREQAQLADAIAEATPRG